MPKCHTGFYKIKTALLLAFLYASNTYSQISFSPRPLGSTTLCTGSLGDPVVNITFGAGSSSGQPLSSIVPGASTSYTFVSTSGKPAAPVPFDGQYTIANNVPVNPAWFQGQPDHTLGDVNGYLAFFNSSEQPGEFYKQKITGLCGNTKYEFAAWVVNVLNPGVLEGVKPDITFSVTKPDGTLLGSYETGPIDQKETYTWEQFGFFFTTPSDVNTVILTMYNNNPGGNSQPGNDLAIDDITFRPCGPLISASFSSDFIQTSKIQCGFDEVGVFGAMTSQEYNNPAFLWQVSTNNGTTWKDIPASNVTKLRFKPSGIGTHMFRMAAAESINLPTSACRVISNTLTLTITDPPQGSFTGSTICEGAAGTLFFSASTGMPPFTIAYSDGSHQYLQKNVTTSGFPVTPHPIKTTNYTLLSITDANGCIRTTGFTDKIATVTVTPKPKLSITSQESICVGDSIQLNVTGGDAYSWSPALGLSNTTVSNPKASPATTTTYQVTASKSGCSASTTTTITVNQGPVVVLTPNADVCEGDSVQLSAGGGTIYLWKPGAGLDNPKRNNPKAAPSKTTIYQVFVGDENGCYDSSTVTVTLRQGPSVSLGNDTAICNFQALALSAKGRNIDNYLWNNGSTDSVLNVVASGTYSIFVKNQCGEATDKVVVKIDICNNDLLFPSAFTPNNDLLNDRFKALYPVALGIYNYELRVYNRWGTLVFSTSDPTQGWDGRLRGKEQKSDVYVWYARYSKEHNGKTILKKGTITLIR